MSENSHRHFHICVGTDVEGVESEKVQVFEVMLRKFSEKIAKIIAAGHMIEFETLGGVIFKNGNYVYVVQCDSGCFENYEEERKLSFHEFVLKMIKTTRQMPYWNLEAKYD